MRLKLEVIDPATLRPMADISDIMVYNPNDTVVWSLDDETALSGHMHYLSKYEWNYEMIRLSREEHGSIDILGTAYAIPESHELVSGTHAGSILLVGTPLALRSTLISSPYMIADAPLDTIIRQVCDISGVRYEPPADMGDVAVSELQIFEAGTSCISIAQAAAERAGGKITQTPEGAVTVRVPQVRGAQIAWTNRTDMATITSAIQKTSTRYETPTRIIATYTGAGGDAKFMSTIVELQPDYPSTRHRDEVLSISDLESPSREQLIARTEQHIEQSMSPIVTDTWTFDSIYRHATIGEPVVVEDADNAETLTGYIANITLGLKPGTPMSITAKGIVE
jgi:hypothetical protein